MKDWPLSAKLTAWSVLIVGLGVLACAIGTESYLRHEQVQLLDTQLKREARSILEEWTKQEDEPISERLHQMEGYLPLIAKKRYIELFDDERNVLYRSPNLANAKLPFTRKTLATVHVNGKECRLGSFQKEGFELRMAADMREVEIDAVERALAILPALPVLIVLTAVGGWWIARKALDPVEEIAKAAEIITAERLGHRLPFPKVSDEIGRLTNVLNKMFDRLDKSFRQAKRFSADASHELKTPLTILRTSIEDLMESPDLIEKDRAAVAGLLDQIHRLSSITESLLLLSRADAGRLTLQLEPANLCELIEACVEDARILAEESEIHLEAKLPEKLIAPVDEGRVTQIILNLLNNAIKYNVTGGVVKIAAGIDELKQKIWIKIGNTGPEISKESANRLFERFYRDDKDDKGHGLGLSIARELAIAHGGDVIFLGSEKGWTEFEIFLGGVKTVKGVS